MHGSFTPSPTPRLLTLQLSKEHTCYYSLHISVLVYSRSMDACRFEVRDYAKKVLSCDTPKSLALSPPSKHDTHYTKVVIAYLARRWRWTWRSRLLWFYLSEPDKCIEVPAPGQEAGLVKRDWHTDRILVRSRVGNAEADCGKSKM